jgi:hypothetical protein
MARWVKIDPYHKTIEEVGVNDFEDIAKFCECQYVERVNLSRWPADSINYVCGLWVDEEGKLLDHNLLTKTTLYPDLLAGVILFGVWSESEDGEFKPLDTACPMDILHKMFTFTNETTSDYEMISTLEDTDGFSVLTCKSVKRT